MWGMKGLFSCSARKVFSNLEEIMPEPVELYKYAHMCTYVYIYIYVIYAQFYESSMSI